MTLVIGNANTVGKQIFDQGYSLAAVIANEFGEAANDKLHAGALDRRRARALRPHAGHQRDRARPRHPGAAPHERQRARGGRPSRPPTPGGVAVTTIAAVSPARRRKDRVARDG